MKFHLPQIKVEKLKELSHKFFADKADREMEDLATLAAANPHDARLKSRIAELHYRAGRIDEAVAVFQEIARQHESEDFTLKAVDTYKNILKIRPDLVDVNLRLSTLYLKLNMLTEAANQLRIAISHYARAGDMDRTLSLAQQLVKVDPSVENRGKLAEIYQGCGMPDEAVRQYEFLAKDARVRKNYDKLLHFYEMILPHRPGNNAILKDICILCLRKKQPERALHVMEQYKVGSDAGFVELGTKARLMMEAIKRQKK